MLKEYKFTLQRVSHNRICWLYNTINQKSSSPLIEIENLWAKIHKWAQFVKALSSRGNCSVDLKPKRCQKFLLLSILYSKLLREYRIPKFKTEDRVRISKYDLPSRKCYKSQFSQKLAEIDVIAAKKPAIYTKKDDPGEFIRGKVSKMSWLMSFNNGLVYNRVGL